MINPQITQLSQRRAMLAALLRQLRLPDSDERSGAVPAAGVRSYNAARPLRPDSRHRRVSARCGHSTPLAVMRYQLAAQSPMAAKASLSMMA